MQSKKIVQLLYLLIPLLWVHVKAQDIDEEIATLLEENEEIDSASNEDGQEFNEIRNKLQGSTRDKEELKAEFENYLARRQVLKDSINDLLKQAKQQNLTPLVNSLIDALSENNAGKEAAIEDAIQQLADSVSPTTIRSNNQNPNNKNPSNKNPNNKKPDPILDPSTSLSYDLPEFIRQFLERGGTLLSPSINQLFASYSPLPQQINDPNNKSVQDLLKKILEKVEYYTNDSDDDYFELLNWFKLLGE